MQLRDTGPLNQEELWEVQQIIQGTHRHNMLGALRQHFEGLHKDNCFAASPMRHAATPVYVRRVRILLTPGLSLSDALIDAWIWWIILHQPYQGGCGSRTSAGQKPLLPQQLSAAPHYSQGAETGPSHALAPTPSTYRHTLTLSSENTEWPRREDATSGKW